MSDLQGSRRAQNFAGQRHEASAPSSAVDLGVDVGGAFTDFVGFRGRDVVSLKLPSTRNPSEAVAEGLRALDAARMAHGTTVATNAILERKGARTAFVTTEGFEHLLLIGRQNRPSLYDLRITRPDPPIPRERCFGLRERVDAHGRVLRSPTKRDLAEVVRRVRSSGAESVAISLLFSFLHPAHEQRLAKALSGLSVSTSHEVLAEFREFDRSSTSSRSEPAVAASPGWTRAERCVSAPTAPARNPVRLPMGRAVTK